MRARTPLQQLPIEILIGVTYKSPFYQTIIMHCRLACGGIYLLLISSIIHIGKETSMKFTDGYWQMRPGITPHYAAQVHEVENDSEAMRVFAATKKLQGRGDTINLPLLTVRFSSPMEGI